MADFGVGLATNLLVEVGKAIYDLVEEVKMNKMQAKVLATRCGQVSKDVTQIVRSHEKELSAHEATCKSVKEHLNQFNILLDSIKAKMNEWAGSELWTRILHKGDMAREIQELDHQLVGRLDLFQKFLSVQNIATTAITVRLMEQSLQVYEAARREDAVTNARIIEGLQRTVELAEENKELLDQQGGTLVEILSHVQKLTPATAAATEDAESEAQREEILKALRKYEDDNGQMPSLGVDSSELTITLAKPFYRGAHAEIFKGFRRGKLVAVKKLNIMDAGEIEKVYKRILNESEIWRLLRHKNVARFLGCCRPKDDIAYMVSEWAPHGDARRYLKSHEEESRLKILVGVARGLVYLHTFVKPGSEKVTPIIHASLKGSNILLDDELNPRLSDFGIAFIANEVYPGSRPPATRWSAPELLRDDIANTKTDVYSLGMVILELITVNDPFLDKRVQGNSYPHKLQQLIMQGVRPPFPLRPVPNHGLPNDQCPLWLLMQGCWKGKPEERPSSTEALGVLEMELEANPSA